MPIILTKEDKYNLTKISLFILIFEIFSIIMTYMIFNSLKDSIFILIWYGIIMPIILSSIILYLVFKYKIYIKLYWIMFCVIIFIPFFTGILETKFLENIPDGSPEFILIMLIFLVFVSLFTLIPTKIVHFLANRYIKMSSPSSEILASNTLCFKIDTENKDSKINSLITMIRKLFDYDLLKNKSDINNDHWLLKSNNQSIDFILIYYLKDILIITPFKNLIYEYNFNTIKLKNSIYDLMLVIYEFEPVDTKTDTNARDAFSDYLKMFQDYSVKKSEIREVFPTIKLIFYGAISIVVILGIFFSYPRIPELLQYLETTGSTGIIIGTIAGAIIVGILSYIYKSLKKKIFNK